jgi:hypothetical protein
VPSRIEAQVKPNPVNQLSGVLMLPETQKPDMFTLFLGSVM